MENLITATDFKNPYKVYGADSDAAQKLDEIIAEFQKPILTQILGEREYNNFNTDLDDGIVPASDEWIWFLDGKTYTYDSESYVYPGIKPVLIKFLYYHWQVAVASLLGETGNLNPSLTNAQKVIPANKMVRAYNKAIDEIINNRTYSPTVYNFLSHQQTENDYFEDWDYTCFEKINTFNL